MILIFQSAFFDREDQALPGFSKFFRKASEEEREHAQKLIDYQNMRGGKVVFQDVPRPSKSEWSDPLDAAEDALDLEKSVNQSLLELHKVADGAGDPQMTDFLEGEFLKEQVEAAKELADLVTKIRRVGATGTGIYLLDKDMV